MRRIGMGRMVGMGLLVGSMRRVVLGGILLVVLTGCRIGPIQLPEPDNETPDDPQYSLQWHLPLINAPQAWGALSMYRERYPVRVAVIDEQVDRFHQDFDTVPVVDGYDFATGAAYPSSYRASWEFPVDHGTHVMGLIAAAGDNGIGVSGVVWDGVSKGGNGYVELMPLNIFAYNGGASESDLVAAVLYAAGLPNDTGLVPSRPAAVINMSLGTDTDSIPREAFELAAAAGVTMVAASGNGRGNGNVGLPGGVDYPAAYPTVIAVGSIDGNLQRSSFSDYGPSLELVAPGGYLDPSNTGGYQIYSTLANSEYGDRLNSSESAVGTSMASPLVAGVVAQMYLVNPYMSSEAVRDILHDTAVDLGVPGWDPEYGYGMVDAFAAVRGALSRLDALGSIALRSPTDSADFRTVASDRLRELARETRSQRSPSVGGTEPFLASRFIVTLDPALVPAGETELERFLRELEARYSFHFQAPGPQWVRAVQTESPVDVSDFGNSVENDPAVVSVSPDSVIPSYR